RWIISEDSTRALVPQMILQPLAENAILHGIASCREGGWIEIQSRKAEASLELTVRNSAGGKSEPGLGLGLQNTKARLKYLYGNDASFGFTVLHGLATAQLTLPVLNSYYGTQTVPFTSPTLSDGGRDACVDHR